MPTLKFVFLLEGENVPVHPIKIQGNAVEYMLGVEYIKAFNKIVSSEESRKVMYLPSQFNVVGATS